MNTRTREGDTLLDFGSGTGALCPWLPSNITYYAHDWAEGMLERVEREHERAKILYEIPDELFDHVVCVGPFNLRDSWSRERTWDVLANLWTSHTRRTLIACLYRGTDTRCLTYTPEDACGFARVVGCHRFLVDASYLDNDLLLEMRR